MLAYFKYSALFLSSARHGLEALGIAHGTGDWGTLLLVALPPGISFYTFQTMSYIIDVYRGDARCENDFWRFAGFVSFFPHLVAGPLTRHHQLIPGLTRMQNKGIKPRWSEGILLFSMGLCKKVLIADRIAKLIDPQIAQPQNMGFAIAWLSILGFALQIYFDFSGYSDMAIGLGRLYGIELPQNFNSPYRALNPSDFWRRWHITLSSWLRDYLYISLGGNQCSKLRRHLNLMITMLLGGLWHGANWTFAAWGFYHGLLLIIYDLMRKQWDGWHPSFQRALTFFSVCIGWVFFRANDFSTVKIWLTQALVPDANFTALLASELIPLLSLGFLITQLFPNASSSPRFARLSPLLQIGMGGATVVALLFMNYSSRFLYFQF